jgi:tetratricopeptide (TPR) repeat protein
MLTPRAAFGAPPSPPGNDAAQKQNQAEGIAARAFDAYSKGDYNTAVALYQQALQIAPGAPLYFNLASIYDKKLSSPQQAIEYYRKCIGAPDVTSELTIKALARIDALSPKPSESAPQPPAKDEKPAGPPPSEPSADPGKTLRVGGLVTGGAGVATLAAGLSFGLIAVLKLNSARKVCDGRECTTQAGIDSMHAASNWANAATIVSIIGGAAIGIGAGLYLLSPKKTEPAPTTVTTVRLTPAIGPSLAGVSLSGAFF